MSINSRLAKLEQRHNIKLPTVGRVIFEEDDAEQAEALWLSENPGWAIPDLLIVRVLVNAPSYSPI